MNNPNIQPEKISTPFQLLAVWFTALIFLVGVLLESALRIDREWLKAVLVIAAIGFVLVFVVLIFLMQTKFRPQMQSDEHFSKYIKERFDNFSPISQLQSSTQKIVPEECGSCDEIESKRIKKYEANRGLFLVHNWRPSTQKDQVADIALYLYQHRNGPLSNGSISSVEYFLGPMFSDKPFEKTNELQNFRLDISAYGPLLCIAKVNFSDNSPSILLERYVDFPDSLSN
jgi:hypothetical protein